MRTVRFLSVAILSMAPAGCATNPSPKTELVIQSASSLADAFAAIESGFEAANPTIDVKLNLAGSQELRTQIENGAAADVFASADSKNMDPLVAANLVGAPMRFACNQLVIAVPIGDATVATIDDLPKASRIVVGASGVPIGAYTRAMLERVDREKPGFLAAVDARVVSRDLNVKQVLAKVTLGEADAAVVYRTDALVAKEKIRSVPIPDAWNVVAEYPIATITASRHPKQAKAFVEYVLSASGEDALATQGFATCGAAAK